MMKIVLLGYMTSGKSTIGKILSKQLNLNFIDLDLYISNKEKLTVPEIFNQKGEIYFRKKENEYLKEILEVQHHFVLSLGGGTPCYGDNLEQIHQHNSTTIYLKASIATLTGRIFLGRESRPLVANLPKEELATFIGKHLFERGMFYEQAKIKIDVNNKTFEEIVKEIILKLY